MLVLKVKRPLLRTSVSVLAVMLMTSGAVAEDEVTAGTEPGQDGISVDADPGTGVGIDPIHVSDPLPPEVPGENIGVGDPDAGDGGDIVIDDEVILIEGGTGDDGSIDDGTGDDGTGDDGTVDDGAGGDGTVDDGTVDWGMVDDGTGVVTGDTGSDDPGTPDAVPGDEVTLDGGPVSECGGCEYQSSAGPEGPVVQRGEVAVQRGEVAHKARRGASGSTAVKDSCLDPERYVAWLCDWQKDLGLIGQ